MSYKLLTPTRKTTIANLVAEHHTNLEIKKIMKEDYCCEGITDNQIKFIRYTKDYYIKEYRKRYLAGIDGSAMFHKRVRLEKIETLYDAADGIKDIRDKLTFKLRCLSTAQSETDSKSASMNLTQYNQYNNFSPKEVIEKINELKKEFKYTLKNQGGNHAQESRLPAYESKN